MARPRVHTHQLLLDELFAMKALFGTRANAYTRLNIDPRTVPPAHFRRLWSWGYLAEDQRDYVALRWAQFRARFLQERMHAVFEKAEHLFTNPPTTSFDDPA